MKARTKVSKPRVATPGARVSHKVNPVAFAPGVFEIRPSERLRLKVNEVALSADVARIFAFGGQASAVSKTMGPFKGEIRLDATGELISTLDDVRVTVTRMSGAQGQSLLMFTLEYRVTSHGWRTGDGKLIVVDQWTTDHEPYGTPHEILFQNSAGGTMYTWNPGTFHLKCGDNHVYTNFSRAESNLLGWFDDWAMFTQYIHGPFFRC